MNDEINVPNVSACWSIQRAGAGDGRCPPSCVGTWGHISPTLPSLSSPSLPWMGSQPPQLSAAPPTPSTELFPLPAPAADPHPHGVGRTRLVTDTSL